MMYSEIDHKGLNQANQPVIDFDSNNLIERFNQVNPADIQVVLAGQRAIPVERWDQYLDQVDDSEFKQTVTMLKEITRYIGWDEFINHLTASFNQFEQTIKNEPFFIHLPAEKFASEYIFVAYFWSRIKQLNFRGFINRDTRSIKEGCNILIIDDAAYTGMNIIGTIDELHYYSKTSFNYYVVVASAPKEDFVANSMPSLKGYVFTNLIIPQVPVTDPYHARLTDYLTPLYFDHKVAGDCSTFTDVYLTGHIPDKDKFGMLLPHRPDTNLKQRLYLKYFEGVVNPPTN